ncbi:MAG: DinB family protein [Acidobacteria bacterium]|nr:DinB family protein [Acidobacteriota bacterium]
MISKETLCGLFEYNYWARDRQLQSCASLTQEQFLRPMGSSYSSLRDTLAHLVAAEWVWLERWHGRSPRTREELRAWQAEEFSTLAVVEERWRAVESGVREYLAEFTEENLVRPLTYVNLNGETWTYPLWQTLFHLVNHQTYHRGQVTGLLRQLGASPAQIDYLVALDFRLQR